MMMIAAAAGMVPDGTTRVIVDGGKYRVTVKAGAVTVARKSLVVNYTPEERDRQRRAVVSATGCGIVDEFPPEDGRLRGKLSC